MAEINLTGEREVREDSPLLRHESRHVAEGVDCEVKEVSKWANPEEKENKLLMNWLIDGSPYAMFLNPAVSKGSTVEIRGEKKTYDNSKAYDTIEKLNLMDDFSRSFGGKVEASDQDIADFFNERINGVKAIVEISNGKAGKRSNIKKVIELVE